MDEAPERSMSSALKIVIGWVPSRSTPLMREPVISMRSTDTSSEFWILALQPVLTLTVPQKWLGLTCYTYFTCF